MRVPLSERNWVKCPKCSSPMLRMLPSPNIIVDHSPSISEFNNPRVKDSIPRDEKKRKRKGI